MKKELMPDCAQCEVPLRERICLRPEGKGGKGCPTLVLKALSERALAEYRADPTKTFARQASVQEGSCYADREKKAHIMKPVKPRIQEIAEFAERMGYRRLGLIFCTGLYKEAAVVSRLLKGYGVEVVSVTCKVGSVPKEEIGVGEEEKVFIGRYESMCNPVLQAAIANEVRTDFNVLLGLCVGHDSLFFKYAEAPTTVLAVKDRVTGHNPLAAVYLNENYYSWLKSPSKD